MDTIFHFTFTFFPWLIGTHFGIILSNFDEWPYCLTKCWGVVALWRIFTTANKKHVIDCDFTLKPLWWFTSPDSYGRVQTIFKLNKYLMSKSKCNSWVYWILARSTVLTKEDLHSIWTNIWDSSYLNLECCFNNTSNIEFDCTSELILFQRKIQSCILKRSTVKQLCLLNN